MPAVADRPALNLVFLIDTSGSMEDPTKLGLLKQSLALMLPELRPEDQISIVTYAGSAGLVLPPTPASDRAKILSALDNLTAGGIDRRGRGAGAGLSDRQGNAGRRRSLPHPSGHRWRFQRRRQRSRRR